MTPCCRRISFLLAVRPESWKGASYGIHHSVSALGSSIGTAIRWSVGAAIVSVPETVDYQETGKGTVIWIMKSGRQYELEKCLANPAA